MESPLYEDNQIQIKLADDPEEHWIRIRKNQDEEHSSFYIPRSGLRDFALAERGKLEGRLDNLNPGIVYHLKSCGLSVNDAHIAFLQAYIENEERIRRGVEEMKRNRR